MKKFGEGLRLKTIIHGDALDFRSEIEYIDNRVAGIYTFNGDEMTEKCLVSYSGDTVVRRYFSLHENEWIPVSNDEIMTMDHGNIRDYAFRTDGFAHSFRYFVWNGSLLKQCDLIERISHNSPPELRNRLIYSYSGEQLVSMQVLLADSTLYVTEEIGYEDGYPAQFSMFHANGNLMAKAALEYSGAGLVKISGYEVINGNAGAVNAVEEFIYDSENRMITKKYTAGDDTYIRKFIYEEGEGNYNALWMPVAGWFSCYFFPEGIYSHILKD
ncbi:hypothetical protein [Lentimicrobium sp.]|uniref:hypothetical protein n=1 Tax=Lentimicrobium sp. TaxID=2034841 RepID=UPI002B8A45E9|nr:hypothetical protein [Lentimicrobium sp.]HPF63740.1 hypothetical protein [Lentimicrobium sp.]HPJ62007.1 hypothetical protein [Lentimicrobium sp.]HRW68317.1 hypothetical protein [Lentimicrobium sp.]